MPQTKVNTPSGQVTVDHPAGASEDDILEFAQLQYSEQQAGRQERIDTLVTGNPAEYDPSSQQFQERYGPVTSPLDSFFAGAGKAIPDFVRGAKQLGVELTNRVSLGPSLLHGQAPFQETEDRLREESSLVRERDAPLMSTKSGLAGNVSANIGLALTPARIGGSLGSVGAPLRGFSNPQTLKTAALAGGIQGASQPVGQDESRALNTAIGAGTGAVGKALAQPVANQLSRGGTAAVSLLERHSVPLDAAQRTGSVGLQRLRSILSDSALTGTRQQRFADQQARAYTRAVLKTIGANGDEATPDIMLQARNRIGSVFEDVARKNPPTFDAKLQDDLIDILSRAGNELDDANQRILQKNVDNLLGAVDPSGTINGNRFNSLRSTLGNLMRRRDISPFARQIDDALVDTLERTSPAQSTALHNARQEWRNLKIIQGSIEKDADRYVNPSRLANSIQTKANQNLSIYGLGGSKNKALVDLAIAGKEVLPETIGNSGTAARQQLLGLATLGGGVLTGAANPVAGAGVVSLPFLLQRGLLSQGVLGNVLASGVPGVGGEIVKQAPVQLGKTYQPGMLDQ